MLSKKSLIIFLIVIFCLWIASLTTIYIWQRPGDVNRPADENASLNQTNINNTNENSVGSVRLTKNKYAISEKIEFSIQDLTIDYCTSELPYRILDSRGNNLALEHTCTGIIGHGVDQYCTDGQIETRLTNDYCSDIIDCQAKSVSGTFTWDQNYYDVVTEKCSGQEIRREVATPVAEGTYTLLVTDTYDNVYSNKFEISGTLSYECTQDDDCATGGCSQEICGVKGLVENISSPCLYRSYYECYQFTTCGCVAGKCVWKDNPNFDKCFTEKQGENS